jgi:hypothetical protein
LPVAVALEETSWPTLTVQEAGKIGNQPNHGQLALSNHPAIRGEVQREKYKKGNHGPVAPANPSTDGSRPGLLSDAWPTPTVLSRVRDEETMQKCLKFRQGNGQTTVLLYLEERVNIKEKSWETPTVSTGGHRQADGSMTPKLDQQVKGGTWAIPRSKDAEGWMMNKERLASGKPEDTLTEQATQSNKSNGKLNPRWVETLMGLPVGWTLPSCSSPLTIEPTNSDYSEMELYPQQQNEHLELF